MKWLDRLLRTTTAPVAAQRPVDSTRRELEREASKRRVLASRTQRLEAMLADYRVHDEVLR